MVAVQTVYPHFLKNDEQRAGVINSMAFTIASSVNRTVNLS